MRKIYFLAAGIILLNFLNNKTYGITNKHRNGVFDFGFHNSKTFFDLIPDISFGPVKRMVFKSQSRFLPTVNSRNKIHRDTNIAKTVSSTNGATPIINSTSVPILAKGDSIYLSASPSAGFIYQWYYNGTNIDGAISANYFAKKPGAYTVTITSAAYTTKSAAAVITSAPDVLLTTPEFAIEINDLSCKDSNNGAIHVSSSKKLNFSAVLTSKSTNNSYNFSDTLVIDHLPAGAYALAIKTDDSLVNQTFPVNIKEPAALSVSTMVNQDNKTLQVKLSGANTYIVNIGGVDYKTTQNEITVPLSVGSNKLVVTTDISCQSAVEKVVDFYETIVPYPNPVINILNINIGNNTVNNIDINITNLLTGKSAYHSQYTNRAGVLQPDLSGLSAGLYSLSLHLDNRELVYKIIKN